MDIHCSNCGQKYHIPDYRLEEKRAHFFCEKCDHKIIIDGKDESWLEHKVLSNSPLSSRSIFDGIFLSFNKKNFFLSLLFLLGFSVLNLIFGIIYSNSASFFQEHSLLSGILIYSFTIFYIFAFDIVFYLISKNLFYTISHQKSIKFHEIKKEIFNDLKPIFLFSSGFLLLLGLFILPVFLFQEQYSIIYTGIFHLPLSILLIVFIGLTLFKNIFLSFIALKSRSLKQTIKSLSSFIKTENINIIFYFTAINSIVLIITAAIGVLGTLSLTLFSTSILKSSLPQLSQSFNGIFDLITKGISSVQGSSLFIKKHSTALSAGIYMVGFSLTMMALIFSAYCMNLFQGLSVAALYIMEKNPGSSVNRRTLLGGILLLALLIIGLFFFFPNNTISV